VEHVYDADGNRIRTTVTPSSGPATVTDFLVDTSGSLSQVVAETDGSVAPGTADPLKVLYIRGDNELLALMRALVAAPVSAADWQTRYYHADGIGSIRRLTDEAGNITDGYTYTAFGELLAHTGSDPQPYAFTGEPLDPNSGWQYHRARWIDLRAGRFSSIDPWEGDTADPSTLHRYLYAAGDPLDRLDPSGRWNLQTSLTTVSSIVTVVAMSLPRITSALLTVAQTLAPMELGMLPEQVGIWPMRGAVGMGRAHRSAGAQQHKACMAHPESRGHGTARSCFRTVDRAPSAARRSRTSGRPGGFGAGIGSGVGSASRGGYPGLRRRRSRSHLRS
jgi:RHS repeat-associated protein